MKSDLCIHHSGIDTSTASGKMMFGMLSVFSEFERNMNEERGKKEERKIIDKIVKLFLNDDDFDIYIKKKLEKAEIRNMKKKNNTIFIEKIKDREEK